MYVIITVDPNGGTPKVYGPYQTEDWAKRDAAVVERVSAEYNHLINVFVVKVENI